VELKGHSALVKFPQSKAKAYNLHQLKPYYSPDKNLTNQEEGLGASSEEDTEEATQSINLIKNRCQMDPLETKPSTDWEQREAKASSLIKHWTTNQAVINPYLRELHIRLLRSQSEDPPALTPHERIIYDFFEPWDRHTRTAGSPLDFPEYREGLLVKYGRRKSMNDLPAIGGPAAPQPPQPMAPPAPIPIPAQRGRTRTMVTRRPRAKTPVPPSSMRLRSAGPAEDTGPLPGRKNTRTRTPSRTSEEPTGPGPSSAGPSRSPEPREPTAEETANEPVPGANRGLIRNLRNLGWSLFTGAHNNPDSDDPPGSLNIDAASGPTGPASMDDWLF